MGFPAYPVVYGPTCNRFTSDWVLSIQQQIIQAACAAGFDEALSGDADSVKPRFGCFSVLSSDGDSRRRADFRRKHLDGAFPEDECHVQQDMRGRCLLMHVRMRQKGQQGNLATPIGNSDPLHNVKKVVQRWLKKGAVIGKYTVVADHLERIRTRALGIRGDYYSHLRGTDISRPDAQDVRSALRVISWSAISLMSKASRDGESDFDGALALMTTMVKYMDAFFHPILSPLQRVELVGYVCGFLVTWRLLDLDAGVSTRTNLTKQCFEDMLFSCHTVLFLIRHSRELGMDPAFLDFKELGSDNCEGTFSGIGLWFRVTRTFTCYQGLRSLRALVNVLEGRSLRPDMYPPHRRHANDWE